VPVVGRVEPVAGGGVPVAGGAVPVADRVVRVPAAGSAVSHMCRWTVHVPQLHFHFHFKTVLIPDTVYSCTLCTCADQYSTGNHGFCP
jgi:hypothetical protein